MNIILIRNNYSDTSFIREPSAPNYDTLPETAQLRNEKPLFLPDDANPAHVRLYIAIRICRLGRCISERFASRYYDAATVIPHFMSPVWKAQGDAHEISFSAACGFDGAVPIGHFIPTHPAQLVASTFAMHIDQKEVLRGETQYLRQSAENMIAHISQYHTLRNGDIILLGAPELYTSLTPDHHVETYLNEEKVLSFNVK